MQPLVTSWCNQSLDFNISLRLFLFPYLSLLSSSIEIMARFLPSLPMHDPSYFSIPITFFFVLVAIFSVYSLILFLCGSDKVKNSVKLEEETTFQSDNRKLVSKLKSNISSRALSAVRMMSWRKMQEEGEEEGYDIDEEEAIWRKTILMGERCRPWDFSDKILHDSQGKDKVENSVRLEEETTFQTDNKKLFSKLKSNISDKALSALRMMSWRKTQTEGEGEEGYGSDGDEAIWRKTIMMGERCRPLDYSGTILYDSQGKPLTVPSQDQNKKSVSSEKM